MYKKKFLTVAGITLAIVLIQCIKRDHMPDEHPDPGLIKNGKEIFRFDTFGDEDFWSGILHIDKAIAGKALGGFGTGVSPKTALAVGLKVDADALPPQVIEGVTSGDISLDDPATTLALLKLNAVLGVKGNFDEGGNLK